MAVLVTECEELGALSSVSAVCVRVHVSACLRSWEHANALRLAFIVVSDSPLIYCVFCRGRPQGVYSH
eukprot:scaffold272779_cov24-Tisochrysis_lutea.AAC.1